MCMHKSYGQAILYRRTIAFQVKINVLTSVTSNDPRLTFYPTKYVEGLKLMHMYQFCGHAM